MSVKIMGLVWDCDLPRNEKYVLLALADHADHEGCNIYPSVERVAWKTGYDERMIQRITKSLVKKGILVRDGTGNHRTNKYKIEIKCLPERPDFIPTSKSEGGKMSPQNVQNVTHEGGKMSPESSFNHPLTIMGASAEKSGLDEFFEPKPPIESSPPLKPFYKRIQDKDPDLMMSALGITAKSQASDIEADLHRAGWQIGSDNIRRAILDFLEATGLPIPAKPERGKWLKHAKEHCEEFRDLKALYRKAWLEYKPQVDAGTIDITHPGALTVKMRALLQRSNKPQSTYNPLNSEQLSVYQQLLEQERNGTP